MKCNFLKRVVLVFTIPSITLNASVQNQPQRAKSYNEVIRESNNQIEIEKLAILNLYKQVREQIIEYSDLINNRSELRKKSLFTINLATSIMALTAVAKNNINYQGKFVKSNSAIGLLALIANSLDAISTSPSSESEHIERIETLNNRITELNFSNTNNPDFNSNISKVLEKVQSFLNEKYLLSTNSLKISNERLLALNTREAAVRAMLAMSAIWVVTGRNYGIYAAGFFGGNILAVVSLLTSLAYDDVDNINMQIDDTLKVLDNAITSIEASN